MMAIGLIIAGVLLIASAFVAKEFYPSDIAGGDVGNSPAPKWLGRLVFMLVGLFAVAGGVALFLSGR